MTKLDSRPPKQGFYTEAPKHDCPCLRQSLAHVLVSRSPLHAYHEAFVKTEDEYTEATDRGQLAHSLLLGGKEIVIVEASDWRTNVAKAGRDAARSAGKIPVLKHKFEEAGELTAKVNDELIRRGLALTGQSELTAIWQAANDVWCQGRLDHWIEKKRLILDLKFVRNANPEVCARAMVDYGYHIQEAAYRQAVETIMPELAGRLEFLFIFVEAEAPHAMTVGKSSAEMRRIGEGQWELACEMWSRYLESHGTAKPWPGYSQEVAILDPPAWAVAKEIERFELMDRQESNAV